MPGPLGGAPPCDVCNQRVYFDDEKSFSGKKWHKKCFRCYDCSKQLEAGSAFLLEEELLCSGCHRTKTRQAAPKVTREKYVNKDDPKCCPRCGEEVYFAEELLALGRKWHKTCFRCASCKVALTSQAADHGGDLYCKACYGRLFGPKGYGFAGGAGTGLSMDTGRVDEVTRDNIPRTAEAYLFPVKEKMNNLNLEEEENGSGERIDGTNGTNGSGTNGTSPSEPRFGSIGGADICPRCNKTVYPAEGIRGGGNSYHKPCFKCKDCATYLDSQKLHDHQGEIYCKGCHAKHFAISGYGYGQGAGVLSTNYGSLSPQD